MDGSQKPGGKHGCTLLFQSHPTECMPASFKVLATWIFMGIPHSTTRNLRGLLNVCVYVHTYIQMPISTYMCI